MISRAPLSTRQFERLCDEFGPCELERGEVVRMSPGSLNHGIISGNVHGLLWSWARKHQTGRVFTNETGLITQSSPDTVRGVDVAYYSHKRLPRRAAAGGFSDVPPNLVVEVVGKGQGWRKMVAKASEYLAMGVDVVWVIEPKTRSLHIFRPDAEPTSHRGQQIVTDAVVLPRFRTSVAAFIDGVI